jgi:hypothetical protein
LYDSRKFGGGQKWRPELLYFQAIKLVELVGIELLSRSETGKLLNRGKSQECPECLKALHSRIHCTVDIRKIKSQYVIHVPPPPQTLRTLGFAVDDESLSLDAPYGNTTELSINAINQLNYPA